MRHLAASCGVGVLAAVMLCSHLDDRDLWSSHEARAAQNAEHVLESGPLGLTRLIDGTPEYQKPPLYYWLVAGIGWLRGGVDEVAVRLPTALAGWLTVVAVLLFLVRRGRPVAGAIAALTLLTANHFLAIARTGRIDVPLTAAVTLAVLAWVNGRWVGTGIAIGVALLLKGPIGLILIVGVALLWQSVGLEDSAHPTKTFRLNAALGIGLLIAGPWFIVVGVETDWEFWRVFFWHHNVARAAGTSAELATHAPWFYVSRWLLGWLPWSPLLLIAVVISWQRRWWCADAEMRLGLVWLVVVTALLSCARFKRADYLLPAYPGAALFLGCAVERWNSATAHRLWWRRAAIASFVAVLAAYATIEFAFVPRVDGRWEMRSAAASVRETKNQREQLIFFRVENHLLAWRLGKPIATVMEWENLDIWVSRLRPGWVMMPAEEWAAWPQHVHSGTLHEVARFPDRTGRERPRNWVFCRSEPHVAASE